MAAPIESIVHGSKATLQELPSVDRLLRLPAARALIEQHGHTLVAGQCRALLEELRGPIAAGRRQVPDPLWLQDALQARCRRALAPRLKRVFNLTGTVVHTNLGRALLAEEAIAQLVANMAAPNNLEFDLDGGGRGDRDSLVEPLLCELTGAEAATVVNNNAAAVLLTLAALAPRRQVIVSRGELVEIGGAFRMPDVMRAAGAPPGGSRNHQRARIRPTIDDAHRRPQRADHEGAHQQLRDPGFHRGRAKRGTRAARARALACARHAIWAAARSWICPIGVCRASRCRAR